MPEHALWNLSRAFHEAITQKRPDLLNEHLDENIDWAVYGPIDMFPFLGARTGRTAVLEACAQIAEYTRIVGMDRERTLLGDNEAAALLRYSLIPKNSVRPISIRLAHFCTFKDDKLTHVRAVIDTFDLVEQSLGRPINLPKIPQ